MENKDIAVGADNFRCPSSTTIDQAVNAIRARFGLRFGGLQDDNVDLINGAALIGDTAGVLSFVGGKAILEPQIQQGEILYLLPIHK